MYRWQGLDEVPAGWGESVVTIGVFDGVHLGHQRIVARAAELGRERGPAGGGDHLRPASGRGDQAGQPPAVPLLGPAARRAARGPRRGRGVRGPVHARVLPDRPRRVRAHRAGRAAARRGGGRGRGLPLRPQGDGRRGAADQARREVRVHRRRAAAARARRRDGLLDGHQDAARRGRRGEAAKAARPPAPRRGRGRPRSPARPPARLPDRERRVAAAHRDPGRRHLRGLARHPGRGRARR